MPGATATHSGRNLRLIEITSSSSSYRFGHVGLSPLLTESSRFQNRRVRHFPTDRLKARSPHLLLGGNQYTES